MSSNNVNDIFLFGKNFKFIRKQLGWSRITMQRRIGASNECMKGWENKNRTPTLNRLVSLSKYFGLSLEDLLLKDIEKEGISIKSAAEILENKFTNY
jgi:transcriptional regulator with XRE-family HTH domain